VAYEHEIDTALDAVSSAAELCRVVRAEMVAVDTVHKSDRSPVTVADFGAQALVCRQLQRAFPADRIVSEEDSRDLRRAENSTVLARVAEYVQRFDRSATAAKVCAWIDAGKGPPCARFWTLDPIDGTKGFLRNDQYAVALALIEEGQVRTAVLACPALPMQLNHPGTAEGVLFAAVKGDGARMRPLDSQTWQPIRVSNRSDSRGLRLVESVEAAHGDLALQEAIARAIRVGKPPLRMDSQAKYGAVARGDAALYLRLPSPSSPEYRENIWDHAAGTLIVEEAGGRVTDMRGRPLDLASNTRMRDNVGVVASNGALHDQVLAALAAACREPVRKAD
jgi:3'(2'), 5'-bisphosphate nucleotidase